MSNQKKELIFNLNLDFEANKEAVNNILWQPVEDVLALVEKAFSDVTTYLQKTYKRKLITISLLRLLLKPIMKI